jgi:FkbM family methyltransferase
MKKFLLRLLVRIFNTTSSQRLLERNVILSHYLMGIGAGSNVGSSGEKILIKKLRQRYVTYSSSICVFDVGANQGQFLKLLADNLKDIPVTFHCFEPAHHTFDVLTERIGKAPNIILNNFGLGDQREEKDLYYDELGSGKASLSKRRLDHFGIDFALSEKVIINTLDDYCLEQKIENIDLLKLDVEGHELSVLKGGENTLRNGKVYMLTFEFGGCNIDSRTYFQDFWYLLQDYGLRYFYRITPMGLLVYLPQYDEIDEQFRTTNYLVCRESL